MARHLSAALPSIRHFGECVVPSTGHFAVKHLSLSCFSPSGGWGYFRTAPALARDSKRRMPSLLCSSRFLRHFTTLSPCTNENATWMNRRISQQRGQHFNHLVKNLQGQGLSAFVPANELFTCAIYENRFNKSSFDTSGLGTSTYFKRKFTSIGRIPNNNAITDTFGFLQNNRTRLKRHYATKTKRENIKTIPNLLTTLRMASAPLLSYLVISDYYGCALSFFVLAGLSDVLDGYIARNFKNQRTAFGTALDPLADKFLVSFLAVALTVNGLIPVPLTVLIMGRDAGLVVASFYIRYISLSPPKTLKRYFDFSHVTAKIYPSNISKINTAIQLSYLACALASPVFDFVESPWLQLLMYTTAGTTFLSGADYMLTWRRRLKIIKNN